MKLWIKIPSCKDAFRFGWCCYKTISVIVFSLFIVIYLPLVIDRNFSYVQLPNGIKLSQSLIYGTGGDDFIMHDKNGNFVLHATGGHIAWQDGYVFGIGIITAGDSQGDEFIYKNDWEKPIIYHYDSKIDYLRKYNLRGSIDYSPELFESAAYQNCLQYEGNSDCKFRALNQYWWDVEDGKREPYKCIRKSPEERCHAYGLYKTYLSLIKMPRYKRRWYE